MQLLRNVLYIVLLVFLGYTFAYKVMGYDDFVMNLLKTSIYSPEYIDVIAVAILVVEGLAIFLLLFTQSFGVLYTMFMFLLFTAYIIVLYLNGRYEVCGCGGVLNGLAFHWHLLINIVLVSIAVFLRYEELNQCEGS